MHSKGTGFRLRATLPDSRFEEMAEQPRRLAFVKGEDLELWRCRPIGSIAVLDLRDHRVGGVDGLILDVLEERPLFLVVRRDKGAPQRFLVPIGDAWFDDTERAIRIDVGPRSREVTPFHRDAFERMSEDEAAEFERTVLGRCCPEVGFHRDGRPNYAKSSAFQCPAWLRPIGEYAPEAGDRQRKEST
jgi:hypothetical protein